MTEKNELDMFSKAQPLCNLCTEFGESTNMASEEAEATNKIESRLFEHHIISPDTSWNDVLVFDRVGCIRETNTDELLLPRGSILPDEQDSSCYASEETFPETSVDTNKGENNLDGDLMEVFSYVVRGVQAGSDVPVRNLLFGSNTSQHVADGNGVDVECKFVENGNTVRTSESEDSEGASASAPVADIILCTTKGRTLKVAFLELQKALPSVPPNTKLSKLDVLVLATTYITHLMELLDEGVGRTDGHLTRVQASMHPIKKWPMRRRLYSGLKHRMPTAGRRLKRLQ